MRGADTVRILNGRTRYEVKWIVGNLHVGTSNRDVIAEFYRRLPAVQRSHAHRQVRHAAYRWALLVHARNRNTYLRVMRGL